MKPETILWVVSRNQTVESCQKALDAVRSLSNEGDELIQALKKRLIELQTKRALN